MWTQPLPKKFSNAVDCDYGRDSQPVKVQIKVIVDVTVTSEVLYTHVSQIIKEEKLVRV